MLHVFILSYTYAHKHRGGGTQAVHIHRFSPHWDLQIPPLEISTIPAFHITKGVGTKAIPLCRTAAVLPVFSVPYVQVSCGMLAGKTIFQFAICLFIPICILIYMHIQTPKRANSVKKLWRGGGVVTRLQKLGSRTSCHFALEGCFCT